MIIKPFQSSNFFTDQEYNDIYKMVDSVSNKGLEDHGNQYAYWNFLPNNGFIVINSQDSIPASVRKKCKEEMSRVLGEPCAPVGILFARYTLDSGSTPSLMPHSDRSEFFAGLYGTVELNKTLDWDFYVEDQKFEMTKNSIVWFTGTHQPHWRPDKDFTEKDHYDILLFQTHAPSDTVGLDEEFFNSMDNLCGVYVDKYAHMFPKGLAKEMMVDGCQ